MMKFDRVLIMIAILVSSTCNAFSQTKKQTLVCEKIEGSIVQSITVSVPFDCVRGRAAECEESDETHSYVSISPDESFSFSLSRYSGMLTVARCLYGWQSYSVNDNKNASNNEVVNFCKGKWYNIGQAKCAPAKRLY